MGRAPVVLDISRIGNIVPLPADLDRVLGVLLSVAEQEIGKVIASESAIKVEVSLGIGESILCFLVDRPACAHSDLVRALSPGNIVAELIVIRLVIPRGPVGSVIGASASVQIDRRNAVVNVGSAEQPIEGKPAWRRKQASRNDMDAVAVVVECRLIEQRRAYHVSGVDHSAVGRISENVADRGNIVATPLGGSVSL